MEYNGQDYTSYVQVVGMHFDEPTNDFVIPLCFALSRAVVVQKWNNSHCKCYKCRECEFEVKIERSGDRKWALINTPPLHQCTRPELQIQNSNILKQWIPLREHLLLWPKHGHREVKSFLESPPHGFTVTAKRGTILKAVHHWRDARKQSAGESHGDLAVYLDLLARKNPTMTVILTVDQESRFHRLFLAFPAAHSDFEELFQKLLALDMFNSRSSGYDGMYIPFCTKSGTGSIVLRAIAICPTESGDNWDWAIQCLIQSGISLDVAIFSDRGCLLSTIRNLFEKFGIELAVKLCIQHIIRNIVFRFKLSYNALLITSVRLHIHAAQAALTINDFFGCFRGLLVDLSEKGMECNIAGDLCLYVLRIPPKMWTTLGNLPTFRIDTFKKVYTEFRISVFYLHFLASDEERRDILRNLDNYDMDLAFGGCKRRLP
jgi:hypothetical protein